MALPSSTNLPPVSVEGFTAERASFWSGFTNATTGAIVVMVLLLVGMAVFLL